MAILDLLLPEFDHEMGTTRRVLERVPEQDFGWTPHTKSLSLGQLAAHIATLPQWVGRVVTGSAFDIDTRSGVSYPAPTGSSPALVKTFDDQVAAARATLSGQTDATLLAPWTLKRDGRELFTMPRIAALRSMVMNHGVHHRGQLSVYLRLRDVPLPSIYGPTADEG